jgi:hypothetical protein
VNEVAEQMDVARPRAAYSSIPCGAIELDDGAAEELVNDGALNRALHRGQALTALPNAQGPAPLAGLFRLNSALTNLDACLMRQPERKRPQGALSINPSRNLRAA